MARLMKQTRLFPELDPASISDMMYGRAEVTLENLRSLKNIELDAVAALMGIPTYGTKSKKIYRILDLWNLRQTLTGYKSTHEGARVLADFFRQVELHDMCRRAKAWRSSPTKLGLAISLIHWRDACQRKGQAILKSTRRQKHEKMVNNSVADFNSTSSMGE